MSPRRRFVHLLVHHDGAPASRSWRIPLAWYRAIVGLSALAVLTIIVSLLFLGPIVRSAGRVPRLEQRIRNLELENGRIAELASALDTLQLAYDRVREMMGANVVPDLAEVANSSMPIAPVVDARADGVPVLPAGTTAPRYWPVRDAGFVTRGVSEATGGGEEHPGVDIALAIGTPIRAVGGGKVADTGQDADYGLFVRMQHADGYESMYGHLDRVVVVTGQSVDAGEVVALSGNSGRSSAPHLHLEIRRGGRNVDPLALIQENR